MNPEITLIQYSYQGSNGQPCTATATINSSQGQQTGGGRGNGPVEALFNAINSLIGIPATLEKYRIYSADKGPEADGIVDLCLKMDCHKAFVTSQGPDIVVASAKAYIAAYNVLLVLASQSLSTPAD